MSKEQFEKWLASDAFSEEGTGAATFVDVAKVRVDPAWEGWTNGQRQYFTFKPDDPQSKQEARTKCETYIRSGENTFTQYPSEGLLTTVYGDDIPTNKNGRLDFDAQTFAKKYDADSRLSEDERAAIGGPMPYNMVINAIHSGNTAVFMEEQWCKVSQEVDLWAKYKGRKIKGYPIRIHIVQKVYSSEAEAKADALTIKASKPQDNVNESGLSPTALENFKTLEQFQAISAEIHKHIANATKGVGVLNNEIEALSLVKAKRYVGEQLGFEVADLNLIEVETPI